MAYDYTICISCGGLGSVRDIGSGEDRPCSLCREPEYSAWIADRQPSTRHLAVLDDQDRCCGRKPMVYKRPHRLYCPRCNAEIDPATRSQVPNWAWKADGDAFVATSPTSDYAKKARAPA